MVAGRRGDGEQDRVQSGSCGISAKKDWADSDMFGKIGQFITTLPAAGARELPAGDNARLRRCGGIRGVRSECEHGVAGYPDACAVLGPGQGAIADHDVTEFQNTSGYRELVARMGG